jgi:hypothetical protein
MRVSRHVTVIAYLALFIALGGTAYAATGGTFLLGRSNQANATSSLKNTGSGAALKLTTGKATTPPLAVSNGTKITHLNADELDGLSSAAFQRKFTAISANITSPNTSQLGTVGPWSMSLKCNAAGFARITITGPGNAGATTTRATNDNAGNTFVAAMNPIGAGFVTTADTDEQLSWTVFLQSSSTIAEVNLLLTASNGGLFENCGVTGAGVLVAS